uniref:Uncharacterized protein n=1 Tax=Octactis speculum TaxID=3111310 RepID=A0A7S2C5H2_9STRA|mmetsp:Transcript_31920/g.43220  ORF Transcript_31920/g.43220 Transcript_31920/m.43220 type:complete len:153 (+) Transcript_31920:48-506(+)
MLGGAKYSYERYHQSKLANLLFTAALHDRLTAKEQRLPPLMRGGSSGVKALACTPGVCGTDMFVHATSQMRGAAGRSSPVDLSRVPSVEDGSLAQLKCICDPSVKSGQLFGPQGMGGLPTEIPLAPPTILVDRESKDGLWAACEKAVGVFSV